MIQILLGKGVGQIFYSNHFYLFITKKELIEISSSTYYLPGHNPIISLLQQRYLLKFLNKL
jgi:hypothetical protein